jgi:hypothetical protein
MAAQHRTQHRQTRSQPEPSPLGALGAGLLDEAGSQASQLVGWLRNEGTVFAATRKDEAADELSKFSAAIRRAATQLNEENNASVASYVQTAADSIDKAADYLQKRNVNDLVEDASEAAKRNPALFLGGVFIAGLAAARFIKAANPPEPRD